MAKRVRRGGLRDANLLDRALHRFLHGGRGTMVTLHVSAPRIFGTPPRRKHVLPPPFRRCIRIFLGQGLRHGCFPVTSRQILLPNGLALSKLPAEWSGERPGEHRPPILLPLASSHRDLLVVEIQALHPQPECLR